MNGDAFATYVETQIAPVLQPGTVVILDNLSTQKERPRRTSPPRQGLLVPLPAAYSPDLNPIEMAFAKLKQLLRGAGARTFDHLIKALGDICNLFTPEECSNYIRHAGYVST